jgi:hypothetical protein
LHWQSRSCPSIGADEIVLDSCSGTKDIDPNTAITGNHITRGRSGTADRYASNVYANAPCAITARHGAGGDGSNVTTCTPLPPNESKLIPKLVKRLIMRPFTVTLAVDTFIPVTPAPAFAPLSSIKGTPAKPWLA